MDEIRKKNLREEVAVRFEREICRSLFHLVEQYYSTGIFEDYEVKLKSIFTLLYGFLTLFRSGEFPDRYRCISVLSETEKYVNDLWLIYARK